MNHEVTLDTAYYTVLNYTFTVSHLLEIDGIYHLISDVSHAAYVFSNGNRA